VVADYSAIEARVIAWLAGEQWVNEVFATHGRIYEATASQMFHVPIEKIKKGNPEYALRQKGKVATLALGYQGGASALIAMGALNMGLTEDELPDIVTRWRQSNPHIKDLWYAVENAALKTMTAAQPQTMKNLIFRLEGDMIYGQNFLTVQLPSGRKLFYPKPFLQENRFGKMAIHYYSVGQQTRKWEVTSTYGGKMTENIVQAIARDCLAVTIKRIQGKGWQTVFHVHDEVIVDAPMDVTVDDLCELMAEPIPWAPGLILKGAGFENNYYMKD
jgi:DNA polymerase